MIKGRKAGLTVVVLLILCLLPGLGWGVSGESKGAPIRNTAAYAQWKALHQRVCDLMGQQKFSQAFEESKPLIGFLEKLNLTKEKEMFETCNNLGAIHLHMKMFQQAHNYFWTAMKLGDKLYGTDSVEVGFVFRNLSLLYGERANQIFILHKEELGLPANPAPPK
ncbi:MAG: tetratricopeptide repeat protein [Desulfatibacillum sp.]|nr:tetratricopeptide repeat protein [Desulfatibacillum sp.]